jgi:tryptophan synthase alpha subunit
MAQTIGGWYVRPEDELQDFAEEVAQIVKQKLNGTYTNIEPEVVGGWSISPQQQMTMKAEVIADAIVVEIEEA